MKNSIRIMSSQVGEATVEMSLIGIGIGIESWA